MQANVNKPVIYISRQLNIREILNLYIADGFFKYQTNYMNAKLSLADLKLICEYVSFKIKTQNYLGLAIPISFEMNHQFFIKEQQEDQVRSAEEGRVFTRVVRLGRKGGRMERCVVQVQLFLEEQKVHVNVFKSRSARFRQRVLFFKQAEECYPQFTRLVRKGLCREAMEKLGMSFAYWNEVI